MSETYHERRERRRPALPLWLWMLLLTAAIVALLIYVGRNSFAA